MKGGGCVIILGVFLVLATHQAQGELVSFLEGGFSWTSQPLPNEEVTPDGRVYRPVIQGYPLGAWEDTQTIIQILQADVVEGSELDKQVDEFMPPELDEVDEAAVNDLEVAVE